MRRNVLLFLLLGLLPACRERSAADVAAWDVPGNREAARSFIVATVAAHFPGLARDTPAVLDFASALEDVKTGQTESAAYVLEEFWRSGADRADPSQPTPLARYVVQEFVTHTNYLTAFAQPGAEIRLLPATDGVTP